MELLIPSSANLLAAFFSLALGIIVLTRNPRQLAHQTFALLAINFMLWALGVFAVIQGTADARFWLGFTEVVSCFIGATCYHFVGYFPKGRFEGNKKFLYYLYGAGVGVSLLTLTPWYIDIDAVFFEPGEPPKVTYGWAYSALFLLLILPAAFAIIQNLRWKLRETTGQGRRQTQFVLFGMCAITACGVLFNFTAALLHVPKFQAYGPVSGIMLMSLYAFAMIRYHLLDTRQLVSRVIVYSMSTGFVAGVYVAMALLLRSVVGGGLVPVQEQVVAAVLSAILIVLAYEKLLVRFRALVEGTLLRKRYDVHQLYRRVAEQAAEVIQLDKLLTNVAADIQETIGVRSIRVLLIDENDSAALRTEFTTTPDDTDSVYPDQATLIAYLRRKQEPVLLEKLLHDSPDVPTVRVAQHLAEMDAYFCLPLKTGDGLVGVMTLGQKNSRDPYTADEVAAFHALAGPLGTAIDNARLYQEVESINLHLSRVFAQMREGVIAVDNKGKMTTVNEAAMKIMGRVPSGASLDLLTPEIAEVLDNTLRDERPISDFETTIQGPEGESVPVIMSSSCLRNSKDETTGAVALLYDLSPLKRLEDKVMRADRLSSIGTLAAGMAHEIKNPLVSIKTFSQLLPARHADPEFRATFHEIVPQEVDRIDTIVSRLLDFARPRPVEFESLDVAPIIDDVLALVDNQTYQENIKVSTKFPVDGMLVHGDDQQIHQVFLNLVLNAIEAMKGSGGGHLSLMAVPGHMLVRKNGMRTPSQMECIKITVTDTGSGIPRDRIPELFTPFFTTKDEGSGLGLAVVHGIVTEHGGEIDVTSDLNRGTTFTISLPVTPNLATAKTE